MINCPTGTAGAIAGEPDVSVVISISEEAAAVVDGVATDEARRRRAPARLVKLARRPGGRASPEEEAGVARPGVDEAKEDSRPVGGDGRLTERSEAVGAGALLPPRSREAMTSVRATSTSCKGKTNEGPPSSSASLPRRDTSRDGAADVRTGLLRGWARRSKTEKC